MMLLMLTVAPADAASAERLARSARAFLEGSEEEVVHEKDVSAPFSLKIGWFEVGLIGGSKYSMGKDAPDELGAQKEAVARCGLGQDDRLSGVVVAADTGVGPWQVEILESPSPEVGACVARLLEAVPWDREHPSGSSVRLAFRVTGAAVDAWLPPEERDRSLCQQAWSHGHGFFDSTISRSGLGHWAVRMSCPASVPMTRLELELQDGVATAVRTDPPVPCAEELAWELAPQIWTQVPGYTDPDMKGVPAECVFEVPLLSEERP
jgi:hypothetical protein